MSRREVIVTMRRLQRLCCALLAPIQKETKQTIKSIPVLGPALVFDFGYFYSSNLYRLHESTKYEVPANRHRRAFVDCGLRRSAGRCYDLDFSQ